MPSRRQTTSVSGNRRVASSALERRRFVLEVKARKTTAEKIRRRKVTRWIFLVLFWTCFATGFGFSIQTVLEKFFLENPDYHLVHVELEGGDGLEMEEVLRVSGISLGMNLFRIDLGLAEAQLEKIPEVVDARIRRELPDTVRITSELREPVAWVLGGAEGEFGPPNLLVDVSGHIYQPHRVQPSDFSLPVITGVGLGAIEAGDPLLRQDLREALTLLQTLRFTQGVLLELRSIDISKGYCLVVRDSGGTEILFATGDYPSQIARLQKLLEHCRETGRELEMVNLIPKRNTPVRFVLAAVPRAEPLEPNN